MNPLIHPSTQLNFDSILPEHIGPALDTLFAQAKTTIGSLCSSKEYGTFETVCIPLMEVEESITKAWKTVVHLNGVVDTPAFREAYNANVTRVPEFFTTLGQNQELLAKYKEVATGPGFTSLNQEQKQVVAITLRNFRLSGADLEPKDRERFAALAARLSEIDARFSQNYLDATQAYFKHILDSKDLPGVPTDALAMYAEEARSRGLEGFVITLQVPSFLPIMEYCGNRELRQELYHARSILASEFGPPQWDNGPLIRERLQVGTQQARLLGYDTMADLSLDIKMAKTKERALSFVRDLAAKAKPFGVRDRAELDAFAARELGLTKVEPWDIPYVSEKLRVATYSFSSNEVRNYFTLEKVLKGLFETVELLFAITITEAKAPVWHRDVRYFEVYQGGTRIAGFWLDLFARQGKQGGAWMDDAQVRTLKGNDLRLPLAFLNCNFTPPQEGKEALLFHDDVVTLFHEFGHGLHLMLTQGTLFPVSGINGVEWDAVELPSQIMENFCWEWERLVSMSSHGETGEALPRALYDKMVAAKNFQNGMFTLRQLEFGLFDLLLHGDPNPDTLDWNRLLQEVRAEVAVVFPPEYNRFANGFSHIFGGGYTAGYYSYKWAEVLSADAYEAFVEAPSSQRETGLRFAKEVLSKGGSRPAMESFVAFRGREPRVDALLKHGGMA